MNLYWHNFLRDFRFAMPFIITVLVTMFALSIVHYTAVKIAEYHISKHHLEDFGNGELRETRAENKLLKAENIELLTEVKELREWKRSVVNLVNG